MKKLLCTLFATVLAFTAMNVSAMTEDALKDKLTATYKIDGKDVKMEEDHVAEIERYLRKYDISSKDADYISEKFDEALKIAQDGKVTSFTDLTGTEKKQIISIVSDVSKKTAVKVTLTEGGKLTIYESDGKTPFTVIEDKDNGVKQTGSNNIILISASIISVLGLAYVVKKVVKANA